MSRRLPGIVLQFTPSIRPTTAQVSPAVMIVPLGALPGKLRNFAAMLPAGAAARNAGVSYHPVLVVVELFGDDSYAKKAKRRSLIMGPPRLNPYWLKRVVSRWGVPISLPLE